MDMTKIVDICGGHSPENITGVRRFAIEVIKSEGVSSVA
jgi:hypothetical protein